MNSEQLLIDKWRGLNSVQQQEVLDFVDFIAQKSQQKNQSQVRARRTDHGAGSSPAPVSSRVKEWMNWASDNPDDSPGLPDEALSRDSIYSEEGKRTHDTRLMAMAIASLITYILTFNPKDFTKIKEITIVHPDDIEPTTGLINNFPTQ